MTTNTRIVRDHLVPRIELLVAKVNKRAERIGAEGFTLTLGDAYQVPAKDEDGHTLRDQFWTMVPLTITGGIVKIDGYTFAGRVDFEAGAKVVSARPGVENLPQFHNATQMCEHCNTNRRRNAIFIFERDTGGYLQVGRTCLKDFMGHDPEKTLFAAREYAALWGDIDDEILGGAGGGQTMIGVRTILKAGAFAIRKHGFISRKQAEDKVGAQASSNRVWEYLFCRGKQADEYKPEACDEERAEKVYRWVAEELAAKPGKSDYEHNAVELVRADSVTPRRIGLLVSLVATWARVHEERQARENEVNAHVGQAGERRDFEAEYLGVNWFEGQYGSSCIARFRTADGLLVYKGANPFWPARCEAGTKLQFKGTIKAHDEYKGRKQTVVTRCKMVVAA